jgi:hypothetical protein
MTSLQRSHHTNHLLAALAAGTLIVLGAGCGSSSNGESSATTAQPAVATTAPAASSAELSEAEWREQANAICAETAPAIGEAFGAMDPTSPTPDQIENVVSTLVSVNRDTEARIDALAEPTALTDQVKALLDANEQATAAIEQQGPAALDTVDQLFAPVNELATELGLDACA